MKHFDFKDLMAFGMFILALLCTDLHNSAIKKKAVLTMPMVKRLIAHVIKAKVDFQKELRISLYYLKRNASAYESHRKHVLKECAL